MGQGVQKPPPAVKVEALGKRFGRTAALRGVDLEVPPGARMAVFGPNGSGKTTLLRLLAGLSRPTRGRVWVHGMDYRRHGAALRRRVGVVAHHHYLYEDLTAEENLLFYGRMFELDNPRPRVEAVLRKVGLERRRRDRVGTFSRGMQQRVAIARAILHDPDLLLLDEPDTGLDPDAAGHLGDFLETERGGGRTIIMTTHNLRLGMRHCQEYVILSAGRVAYRGAGPATGIEGLEELYASYASAA